MIAWSPVRDDNFYPVMERLMREPQFLEMEFRMGAMPCSLIGKADFYIKAIVHCDW